MSNEYGFFASKNHDRRYSADDFSAFFGDFFTDGVLGSDTNALMVSAAGDMAVNIAAGTAYIKGRWYRKQSPQLLTLADSDTEYDRIDAVVIRCDHVERMVYPYIIEGVPDETAVEPTPVRDGKYYDIVLAYVYVAANCVEVTAADITDKRGFDDVCGYVTSAIDHIDTSGLFAQYDAQWELLKAACSQDADDVIAAWDSLNTVKKVSGIEPVDGNVELNLDNIPDGETYRKIKICTGKISVTENASYGSSAITFPKSFTAVPTVLCSVESSQKGNVMSALIDKDTVTKTGFTVKYVYASKIHWVAILIGG